MRAMRAHWRWRSMAPSPGVGRDRDIPQEEESPAPGVHTSSDQPPGGSARMIPMSPFHSSGPAAFPIGRPHAELTEIHHSELLRTRFMWGEHGTRLRVCPDVFPRRIVNGEVCDDPLA